MDQVTALPNKEEPNNNIIEEKPNKGMPKKTFLLILFLFLAVFGLIGLGLYLNNNQKPKATEVIPQVTPDPVQTILTISSNPTPLATVSAYKTDVVINTGQNSVTSVQLELLYDPKVLTKVDIKPGPFFTDSVTELKNIDPVNGRISFVVSVPNKSEGNGILGQGVVATITFNLIKGQGQTPTYISFLPKSQVTAESIQGSALKSTVDASFTLLSFKPTFTPTPSASPSGQ